MQATGRRYGGIPDGNVSGGQRLGRYGPPHRSAQTFKDTHSEVSKPHRMQKAGKGAHQAGGPGKPHRTLSNWRYKIISI